MTKARIEIPKEQLVEFCLANRIQRLSLFGSVLSDDFGRTVMSMSWWNSSPAQGSG